MVGCGGRAEIDAELAARGQPLYEAACVQCHGGPSGGTISDIPPRHNAEGHTWHHADCLLTDIVLDGMPPRPGAEGDEVMPAFRDELTEDEVEAIIAHVKTWWTDEQREVQADVTAAECDEG